MHKGSRKASSPVFCGKGEGEGWDWIGNRSQWYTHQSRVSKRGQRTGCCSRASNWYTGCTTAIVAARNDTCTKRKSLTRARNFHRPTRSVRIWAEDAAGTPSPGVSFKLSPVFVTCNYTGTYDRKELIEWHQEFSHTSTEASPHDLLVSLRLCVSLSSSLPLFVSQFCHLPPFPLSLILDGCVCNLHVFLTHVFVCV